MESQHVHDTNMSQSTTKQIRSLPKKKKSTLIYALKMTRTNYITKNTILHYQTGYTAIPD